MDRFDGTAARQLILVDDGDAPMVWREAPKRATPRLRLLQKDIYVELNKRRRRAQIAARKFVE